MNAIALALPGHLSAAAKPNPAAPATAAPTAQMIPTATVAAGAGLHLQAETCIAQTAELLRLACRRGQLEDAAAAARAALPLAVPHSPHAAMLGALAQALPADKSLQALEFSGAEARLKGASLSPEQVSTATAQLRAAGYSLRQDGETLLIRAEDVK